MAQSGNMNLRLEAGTAASSRDGERVRKLASELFDALRTATSDGVGITRESYGKGESAALDIIDAKARALGLRTERDAGANLVATLEGTQPQLPFLACGSHLDSVPQGGNFDGAAGVVAGLAVLAGFKEDGFRPRRTLKLFALRGEESARFGKAYMGSSALFGRLSAADLELKAADSNLTLDDCMSDGQELNSKDRVFEINILRWPDNLGAVRTRGSGMVIPSTLSVLRSLAQPLHPEWMAARACRMGGAIRPTGMCVSPTTLPNVPTAIGKRSWDAS
jgi:Peptidase family M28